MHCLWLLDRADWRLLQFERGHWGLTVVVGPLLIGFKGLFLLRECWKKRG